MTYNNKDISMFFFRFRTRSLSHPLSRCRQLPALLLGLSLCAPLAAQQPPPPPGAYDAAPYLGEIRNQYLYSDIWERPGLSARDRSMITVAVNQALYATNELRIHMNRALDNGVTQAEISEIIAHVLWYSGFPTGVNAARVAAEVFAERGLPASPPGVTSRQPPADPEEEFPGAFPHRAVPTATVIMLRSRGDSSARVQVSA